MDITGIVLRMKKVGSRHRDRYNKGSMTGIRMKD